MKPTGMFGVIAILAAGLMTDGASAQINMNLNRPNTVQQLPLPNWQNQQRRENYQLQQQFNREIDRRNNANQYQPNVPVIVPNCRPSTTGSLSGQSCR